MSNTNPRNSESRSSEQHLESNDSIAVHTKEELDKVLEIQSYRNDVLACIRSRLMQNRMINYVQASEIFAETYLRAEKHLAKNERIPNIVAWLKLTSYNVIREERRKQINSKNISQKLKPDSISNTNPEILESSVEKNKFTAFQSFQKISRLEQRIIHFWKIKELSWKEVCTQLKREGLIKDEDPSSDKVVNRIRRKGARALGKLRDGYG